MERAPVVQCQQCKSQIQITPSSTSSTTSSEPQQPSILSSRLDESFFMLEGVLSGKHPLPLGGGGDRLEESFVLLQQASTSSSSLGGFGSGGGQNQNPQQQQRRFSFDAQISTLARVFDVASEETDFDQPLCIDCVADVKKELLLQIKDLEEDVSAFDALEAKLLAQAETGGQAAPLEERQFARQLKRAQEEVAEEEGKLRKAKEELEKAEKRQAAADAVAAQLSQIELKYWHSFNAVMLFLHAAADYKDSLQQRVDSAEQALTSLRRTNVLASVFHISFDGPYGTISGARLGSTPDNPVEWWEINAAYGQAVLLLDTLSRAVGEGFKFTRGKLEPRGSFSRVHDSRGPAELFGPASKIVCLSFDRAQVAFLACLKEFEVALAQRGATNFKTGGPFSLSFPIDGDRVAGYSIRYGLSRDKAWTKALKYMLLDLKFCTRATLEVLNLRRHGIGGASGSGGGGAMAALPREGPGAVLRHGAKGGNNFVTVDDVTVAENQKLLDIAELANPSTEIITSLIANGNAASYGQFPFMVSLQYNFGSEDSWPQTTINGKNYSVPTTYHKCGGSLIWPNLVLTAGHCLGTKTRRDLPDMVLVGGTIVQKNPTKLPLTNSPEKFVISGYTVHPEYQDIDNDDSYNDIAILRLSGLSQQSYANLSTKTPPKGQALTAIGWGKTEDPEKDDGESDFSSEILMYTEFKVSTAVDVSPSQGYKCPDLPGILCISTTPVKGQPGAYQMTCTGDSGGPQMLKGTNTQAGLTSFGPSGCGTSTWEAETNVGYYYSSFVWPTMVNFGLPNPIKSKSQCKSWKSVAQANTVYSFDGSEATFYKNPTLKKRNSRNSKACGDACMKDADCYSFSFSARTKKCSLSSLRVLALPLVKKEKRTGVTSGYLECI